jgi:hypothetical protein
MKLVTGSHKIKSPDEITESRLFNVLRQRIRGNFIHLGDQLIFAGLVGIKRMSWLAERSRNVLDHILVNNLRRLGAGTRTGLRTFA